jgi:hypothetical protein
LFELETSACFLLISSKFFVFNFAAMGIVHVFFGAQMALASLVAISGPKKVLFSRAPLPLALVMDLHESNTLLTGPCKSEEHKQL